MRKAWKSYKVFASFEHRLMVLLIIPLAIFGVMELLIRKFGVPSILIQTAVLSLILMYEMLNDYWMFGGICSREGGRMECLKLSLRGNKVLELAVIFDLVRRWLYLMIFGLVCYMHTGIWQIFVVVQIAYIAIILTLNISRYLMVFLLQLMVTGIGIAIYNILVMGLFMVEDFWKGTITFQIGIAAGIFIVCVVLGLLTVVHIRYRWKESYYEKGFK